MYALLASVSCTQHITSWVENRLLACVRFSKLIQFQIHPSLNILTVPNWLNVKVHYFLIGPKVKILKCTASLSVTYTTYHILGRKQTTRIRFSKPIQFQIHPSLNILTVPDWLNVKFHYFLIGPKVKILKTVPPLVPIYITLFPVS